MKYRYIWAISLLLILADGGLTYWAITTDRAEEANPRMVGMMEEYGLVPAIIASIVIRFASVGGAALYNTQVDNHRWFLPLSMLAMCVAPVAWNIAVLFV